MLTSQNTVYGTSVDYDHNTFLFKLIKRYYFQFFHDYCFTKVLINIF